MQVDFVLSVEDSRIYVYHHFLSDDECDYLKQKAEKRLERSGVVNAEEGGRISLEFMCENLL